MENWSTEKHKIYNTPTFQYSEVFFKAEPVVSDHALRDGGSNLSRAVGPKDVDIYQ